MAAIENIIAWAKHEQARLTRQLAELQAGRLRTYEKHAQPPGWLEVDTTEQTVELCRHYLSELSAIIALHPAIVPTSPPRRPRCRASSRRFRNPPRSGRASGPPRGARASADQALHPDWVVGWGVVKGQPPRWQFVGIYETHAEANEAAAEAGEGYYARWGNYNEGRKEFTSGPSFDRADTL